MEKRCNFELFKSNVGGAKNAALAILSAAIMTDETILIENQSESASDSCRCVNCHCYYRPRNSFHIPSLFWHLIMR